MDPDHWNETLAARREAARMTQQELAFAANVSMSTVSLLERGATGGTRLTRAAIDGALSKVRTAQDVDDLAECAKSGTFVQVAADSVARFERTALQ